MFYIQISNPRALNTGKEVDDLAGAIEEIYDFVTEDAVLVWGRQNFRLSYKYDLSIMIIDIIEILEKLIRGDQTVSAQFASNTLDYAIEVKNRKGTLDVSLTDELAKTLGLDPIRENPITIELADFMSEWKGLLECIHHVINKSGVTISKNTEVKRLLSIIDRIPLDGYLYR